MRNRVSAALAIILLLAACHRTNEKVAQNSDIQNADSTRLAQSYEPVKVILKCLYWRHINDEHLSDLWCSLTIPYGCDTVPASEVNDTLQSGRFYSINYIMADSFLHTLKHSNYFTDSFVTRINDYIYYVDDNWKTSPEPVVFKGQPHQFDYDFMMFNQSYEWDSATIAKTEIISAQQSMGQATVVLRYATVGNDVLTYYLTKTDSIWQIDQILRATD